MNEMTNVCNNNNATETPQILSWSTEAVISSTAIFIYIVWVKILFLLCQKSLDIKITFHEYILYRKYINT